MAVPKKSAGKLDIQTAPQPAAQALREAIISGALKGGDRILEQKWSSQLGIGQPTLREAMKELEHQGLLRRTPQRDTYVTELGPEDYRRILEVRIPLEAIAMGRAATRLTPKTEKELVAIVNSMKAAREKANFKRFHESDVSFHRKIWQIAGNEYLQDILETITLRLFVFSLVNNWPDTPNAMRERATAVRQHAGILEGIRSGDPRKAKLAFVTHTVQHWNQHYGLDLDVEELLPGASIGPRPA